MLVLFLYLLMIQQKRVSIKDLLKFLATQIIKIIYQKIIQILISTRKYFQVQINLKRLNSFISAFMILFIFSPFAYAYISITEVNKRTDYPGKQIATKIQYAWDQNYNETINIVFGDEWFAGNLSYNLKSRPVWEGTITKEKLNSLSKFICIDNICVGNR